MGASSGIGAMFARRIASQGRAVALLARREAELAVLAAEIDRAAGQRRAWVHPHDVSDHASVERLFDVIESELGPVDELHYVAGSLLPVAPDEFDTAKDRAQFEVNTLGGIAWCNAAARRFQQRGHGCIVGISSVAQDRGRMGRPAYCASKAAFDTYLESLRNRLWRRGVQVTTLRFGFVDTAMTKGVPGLFWLQSAERAAELGLRAVHRRAAIAYVPARWRPLMAMIRAVPSFLFRRLNV